MDILKKIILTYGFDWEKIPAGQTNDIWRTLDTVIEIKKMLSKMSYDVKTMKVDAVFEEKLLSLDALLQLITNDYANQESFRQRFTNKYSKFGNDDNSVDLIER